MKQKVNNRKFLEQLIKTYIIIICICALAVSGILVVWKGSSDFKRFETSSQDTLKNYALHNDSKLKICRSLMDNIQVSREFSDYTEKVYTGNSTATELFALAKKVRENEQYSNAANVRVVITSIKYDRVISAEGTMGKKEFEKNFGFPETVWKDIKKACDERNGADAYVFLPYKGKFIMVKRYNLYDEKNMYIFAICKNDNVFSNDILKDNGFKMYYGNKLITSYGRNVDIKAEPKKNKYKNKKFKIYVYGSTYNENLRYVLAAKYRPNIPSIILSTLEVALIMFILVVVGVLVSYKRAMKIYRPIDDMLLTVKQYSDENREDENEIDYINRAFRNLVKDNDSFKEMADMGRQIMKQHLIVNWLRGLYRENEIIPLISEYDLKYLQKGARVVLIEISSKREMEENFSKTQILDIRQLIINSISEKIRSYSRCEIAEIDNYKIAVILPVEDDTRTESIMKNIFSQINAGIDTAIAIGDFCTDINRLNDSYENALSMLDMHYINPQKMIFTMADLKNKRHSGYFYPIEVERNLINYAVAGEKENAMRILKNVLEKNIVGENSGNTEEFVFAIVATVKRILQQIDKNEEDVLSGGKVMYLEMRACKTGGELYEKTVEIFSQLLDVISAESKNKVSNTFNKILKYINEHYCEDISLQDIASRFNISVGYVGILISDNLNVSFKNYINGLRVEKAKEILKTDKNIKIHDIPDMIGFNNSVTFLRVFKKYEGMSPTEYLRKLGEENI